MDAKKWTGTYIHQFTISYEDYVDKYESSKIAYRRAFREFIKQNHEAIIWKEGAQADMSSYKKAMKIFSSNKIYEIKSGEGADATISRCWGADAAKKYAEELEKQK